MGSDYVVAPDGLAFFVVVVVAGVLYVFSCFLVYGVVEEEVAHGTLGAVYVFFGYG